MAEKSSSTQVPVDFGILVFPTFQALDAFGPLDALNMLSKDFPMNLSIIARTLDPVSTKHRDTSLNPFGSNFAESVVPTHDFNSAPPLGSDDLDPMIDFVKRTYPSLKYIFTVCTGSWIAARSGILDGRRATSNKSAWGDTKTVGPNVKWVSHARWVVDGNIWTASGVSAGLDAVFAFIQEVYGAEQAKKIAADLEYERHEDPSWDPFAEMYNLPKEGI
ncbi:class I glutamine amidotransferase-like protein [Gymnopus androsaceus JB14]|uniref:Class I glutamine amidotransferase-like protein n=1 Tax=Gymnopus androsaceus JB14 TaxID=1447944 RepID=A0A6A4I4K8_9AGAR|nr:class I glutamine amidotransferase-like protein [Gymnopus androsaceus JB14]